MRWRNFYHIPGTITLWGMGPGGHITDIGPIGGGPIMGMPCPGTAGPAGPNETLSMIKQ